MKYTPFHDIHINHGLINVYLSSSHFTALVRRHRGVTILNTALRQDRENDI